MLGGGRASKGGRHHEKRLGDRPLPGQRPVGRPLSRYPREHTLPALDSFVSDRNLVYEEDLSSRSHAQPKVLDGNHKAELQQRARTIVRETAASASVAERAAVIESAEALFAVCDSPLPAPQRRKRALAASARSDVAFPIGKAVLGRQPPSVECKEAPLGRSWPRRAHRSVGSRSWRGRVRGRGGRHRGVRHRERRPLVPRPRGRGSFLARSWKNCNAASVPSHRTRSSTFLGAIARSAEP